MRKMTSSAVVLAALAALTVACDSEGDGAPEAVAPASTSATEPGAPNTKLTAPEAEEFVPIEFESFKGVANLPEVHPCHDQTPIVKLRRHEEGTKDVWKATMTTFGEHRDEVKKMVDDPWTHLGPRTVKGYRWQKDGTEYVVATCNFAGLGFGNYDRKSEDVVNAPEIDAAVFEHGFCGECNDVERGEVRLLSRPEGGEWTSVWADEVWAVSDEGNQPQYVARGELVDATDNDDDGVAELVSMTVESCGGDDWCEPDEFHRDFVVQLTAREGSAELGERLILAHDDGSVKKRERADGADLDEAVRNLLAERLDAHAIVDEKVRAILRDAKKLGIQ